MAKQSSLYFNIFLIGLIIFIFFTGLQINTRDSAFLSSPMFFPVLLTVIMFILSIVIFIRELKQKAKYFVLPESPLIFFGFIIITFVYIELMPIIGFPFATFLFLFGTMLFLRGTSIIKAAIIAAGLVVAFIILFEKLFNVIFP